MHVLKKLKCYRIRFDVYPELKIFLELLILTLPISKSTLLRQFSIQQSKKIFVYASKNVKCLKLMLKIL